MAAWRSLDAEAAFCEQMVEHAEASSFRNRWDRDRLRVWQQREREASMRLRATRAALTGREPTAGVVECERGTRLEPVSRPVSPAPLAALPDPTLFDERTAA